MREIFPQLLILSQILPSTGSKMAVSGFASLSIRASWDVGPRTIPKPISISIPNPNLSLKNNNPKKVNLPILQTTSTPTTTTTLKKEIIDTSELLKLNSTNPIGKDEWDLDNEVWLPVPPVVKLPRSMYNAASLAYLGDCVFELYTRRHFLFPPLDIEEYNHRVMAVVRCEAQDALLKKLLNDDYLSEGERDILRWGKNIDSGKTRTTKRAGVAVYNSASSLETLVGYLYLTNVKRLDELMLKIGFLSGASKQPILEETESELHLGCEKWSPVPPKVKKPRPVYKAASLAYLGDCIYELYARRHFLFPPLNIEEYNDHVMAVVCCEAQDALLKKLPNDEFLPQERDILRRGRYINSGKTRTTRRAGVGVYNRASSLETLVGFLYLTNEERLDELMFKMGFSKGTSKQPILEETEETESKST